MLAGRDKLRRVRPRRIVAWGLLVPVAALALFLAATPTGRYLARAGWEEAKILAARRPIAELVSDARLDPVARAKLQLVLAARAFARDSLGLAVGQSFSTYAQLERDTLVLVLSAAYEDRLQPKTWWFPIVGRVPYKGFFDFGEARRAARELDRTGFDSYLRPASAFSTLGWFNDPLLSTTLRLDSAGLAETVIHELTHNTFYAPGQAIFNESFANFVGARGAERFFGVRGDSSLAARSRTSWEDEKLLGAFWTALYHRVDSAFRAHTTSRAERLRARRLIYDEARATLTRDVAPALRTIDPRAATRMRLDNAALLARRVYMTDLALFDSVLARSDGDLRRASTMIISLARSRPRDPYGAVRAWVGSDTETARRVGR